ncbi:hypothetical protein DITRI_Ditri06bG0131000 [Diplodiscus trichospermus]
MSFVKLEDPEIEVLQQLLPCNPLQHLPPQSESSTDQVMLAVQINGFACRGMAIGVCISHAIADTSAAAHFLKLWAAVACGDEKIDQGTAALRNEMGDEMNSYRPTRVEAVTALIWEALMAATAENGGNSPILAVAKAVHLRKRMNPPLPQQCIGNCSWCRFPFYEIDFGWGKPILYQSGLKIYRLGYFLDTSDGDGIEAWITLSKAEMAKLEQRPGILAYATFQTKHVKCLLLGNKCGSLSDINLL